MNGNLSNAGNWSSGGVPTLAETNILVFPSGATRTLVTNDIGALRISAIVFSGSNYVVRGASTLTLTPNLLNMNCNGLTNTIESPVNFLSVGSINVTDGNSMTLSGAVSGTNGMAKIGYGDLYFRGAASNPLSGELSVSFGELHFAKSGGAAPYNGNRIEVGSQDVSNPTRLILHADDSIPDGVDIILHPSAVFRLLGVSDNVNSVTMTGGLIDTGSGILGINDGLHLTPRVAGTNIFGLVWESPTLWGKIEFHGIACQISASTNVCKIEASIVENGTPTILHKTGPGHLSLMNSNSFTGRFDVQQGTLFAAEGYALGTVAGNTTVSNGASLKLGSAFTWAEPLVLSGPGHNGGGALQADAGGVTVCAGTITLSNLARVFVPGGEQLQFTSVVGGPGGIEKSGPGDLLIAGVSANTFAGASAVNAGRLLLNKPSSTRAIGSVSVTNGAHLGFNNNEQMDNAGVLSIYANASVNLTNRNETIGGLNIGANHVLDVGTGTLTLLGNVFAGAPYSTNASPNRATIRGLLSLGGAMRAIVSSNNVSVWLDCNISDGAGVGGLDLLGDIWLVRSNSFTGPVNIHASCHVLKDFSFGAAGGGVYFPTNTPYIKHLFLHQTAIANETLFAVAAGTIMELTIYDTNTWNGPIVFTNGSSLEIAGGDDEAALTVNGPIVGSNFNFYVLDGTLRLNGTNTYTGMTSAYGSSRLVVGNLRALGATNAGTFMGDNSTLELNLPSGSVISNEVLQFTGGLDTTNHLIVSTAASNTWRGPVSIGNILRVQVPWLSALNLDATISGFGNLEKTGGGSLYLTGTNANSYPGETVVSEGLLYLGKPNGVRAIGNLTVSNFAETRWSADRQMADGSTLRLFRGDADLQGHNETIAQLAMDMGWLNSQTGTVTLLGDIDATPDPTSWFGNSIYGRLCLSAGTHQMFSATTKSSLNLGADICETNGVVSLNVSNLSLSLYGSNTFSGPLNMASTEVWAGHPLAFGSPAQGVIADQFSSLMLDIGSGQGIAGEPLLVTNNFDLPLNYFRFGPTNYGYDGVPLRSNFWSGSISLDAGMQMVGPTNLTLNVSGPIFSLNAWTGDILSSSMKGALWLSGSGDNTLFTLFSSAGQIRLAKAPGARAMSHLYAYDHAGSVPEIHVEAPNQFAGNASVRLDAAKLFLHDYPTRLSTLVANEDFSYVYCGTNPSSSLTLSNSGLYEFYGAFDGTLVLQGDPWFNMSGSFANGDLLVQGGRLISTLVGGARQTVISPGAIVKSAPPNIFNLGALSGAGTLHIAGPYNWIGGTLSSMLSSTFTGTLIGTNTGANLTKVGPNSVTLAGPVSLVSTALVGNGTLIINTLMNNPVLVNSPGPGNFPTLGGTGVVGNVTLTGNGARIAPGATAGSPSYGRLRVNNLTMNSGSAYRCEMSGTNAGVNHDQVDVSGTVTLSSANLDVLPFGTGGVSNRYTVVKSTPAISGTFVGKSEGSTFSPGTGRSMRITYVGGASGHDIVLTDLVVPQAGNIEGIQRLPDGTIQLGGQGIPNTLYQVQANTNLNTTNWLIIGSVTTSAGGAFTFVDTNVPSFPMRFYRFLQQ